MTKDPKRAALAEAKTSQDKATRAAARALGLSRIRDEAVWNAQVAGATYPEIQEATGLSQARVTQILRKERARHSTPQP